MEKLSPYYKERFESYVQFSKYKRDESLREYDLIASEFKETNVVDDHFVRSDVTALLDKFATALRTTIEKEISSNQHSAGLMLQSIFTQADALNLQLKVDTASLEDGDALRSMAKFEQEKTKLASGQKLPSLGKSSNDPAILLQEVNTLREENKVLRDRLQKLTGQSTSVLKEKSAVAEEIDQIRKQLDESKLRESNDSKQIITLKAKVDDLTRQLAQSSKTSAAEPAKTQKDPETEAQLKAKVAEVDELRKELSGKVQSTSQFASMKKMVQKKNDQVKDLLTRLRKYEPSASLAADEDDE